MVHNSGNSIRLLTGQSSLASFNTHRLTCLDTDCTSSQAIATPRSPSPLPTGKVSRGLPSSQGAVTDLTPLPRRLGIPLTPCQVSKFSALETSVQIHASVRDEDVFIIQSPSPPSINDHLMELLIMISGQWTKLSQVTEDGPDTHVALDSLQDRIRKADHRRDPLLPIRPSGQEGQVAGTYHGKVGLPY